MTRAALLLLCWGLIPTALAQEADLEAALRSGERVAEVARTLVSGSLQGERQVAEALGRADAGAQAALATALSEHGRGFTSFAALLRNAENPEVYGAIKVLARRLADQPSWKDALELELVHLPLEQREIAAGPIASAGGEAARTQLRLALDGGLGEVLLSVLRLTPGNCFDASRLTDVAEVSKHPGISEPLRVAAVEALGRCGERARPTLLEAYKVLYPERERTRADRVVVESLHSWLVQLNGRVDFGPDPASWEPNANTFVPTAAADDEESSSALPLGPINAGVVLLLACLSLGLSLRGKLGASTVLLALGCAMLLVCIAHALRLDPEKGVQAAVMWALLGLSLPMLGWSLWKTSKLRPWEEQGKEKPAPVTVGRARQSTMRLRRPSEDRGTESARLLAHALDQMRSLATPRRGNRGVGSGSGVFEKASPEKMQAIPAMTKERARRIESVEATPRRGFRDFDALEVEERPANKPTRALRMWFKVMRDGVETDIERADVADLKKHGVEFIRKQSLALGTRLRAIVEKGKGEVWKTRLHVIRCVPLPDRRHRIVAHIEVRGATTRRKRSTSGETRRKTPARPVTRTPALKPPAERQAARPAERQTERPAPEQAVPRAPRPPTRRAASAAPALREEPLKPVSRRAVALSQER